MGVTVRPYWKTEKIFWLNGEIYRANEWEAYYHKHISLFQMNTRCSFGQMTLKFIWKSKGKSNKNNF